ncbi:helix-turn-helix domain-containing protein [Promicromonospora sp. NPDC060271]|uniref:helix-turn-helix domain-containing protein n=1 Tax=Promicromonospora sp. NPDC060271 TaxID=3347089 RepID=UPI0036613238
MDPQNSVRIEPTELTGWAGEPVVMGTAHQHDDLEINLVAEGGSMIYLFGGAPVEVEVGGVAAFWAAVPHQLVASTATRVHWVHVPFATFLGWGLPESLVSGLLSGRPVVSGGAAALDTDVGNFSQWARDLADGRPEPRRIALLEIEARIRRLGLHEQAEPAAHHTGADPLLGRVLPMVAHIAEHFREPLTVADVAQAARLHPTYAMSLFRKVLRTTIGDYLAQCRLAEARRLILTTDLPVNDVATAAGFGSVSRFYAAFTAAAGQPPARFRREYGSIRSPGR